MNPSQLLLLFLTLIGLLPMNTFAEDLRPVTVALQTPHPGFSLRIERVVLKEGALLVLARVTPPQGEGLMFPMVISEIEDTVQVAADAEIPVRSFVVGRTWGWDDERVTALEAEAAFDALAEGGDALPLQRP